MTMTKTPPPVHEFHTEDSNGSENSFSSSSCPFCTIASTYPPTDPLQHNVSNNNPVWNPEKLSPPSYVLLATEHVVAFLDIAPLTRGHVLVLPRRHRMKVGDMSPKEMSEIGRLLPLIARSVIKAVLPDIPHRDADYNIVQNNGPGAAQVVPHVHFHIVPRPPLDYHPLATQKSSQKLPKVVEETSKQVTPTRGAASSIQSCKATKTQAHPQRSTRKYPPTEIPTGLRKSYVQFGRGVRHELDEDDAESLVEEMRRCVREEWLETFGKSETFSAEEDQYRDQPITGDKRRAREKL